MSLLTTLLALARKIGGWQLRVRDEPYRPLKIDAATLTWPKLAPLIKTTQPTLYYGTHNSVPCGEIYLLDTPFQPWLICHPDDLAKLMLNMSGFRFIRIVEQE